MASVGDRASFYCAGEVAGAPQSKPIGLLPVNNQTLRLKHAMQHWITQCLVLGHQLDQACMQRRILRRYRLIAKSGATNARQLAGSPFTKLMSIHHVASNLFASSGRYHFFEITSFIASTSSRLSASSLFSLLFSVSRSRRRLASLTSKPRNLLRQL